MVYVFPTIRHEYWKVTVDRPLRLQSQLSVKAIESLRFASGDEELRSEFYEEIGEQLFDDFAKAQVKMAILINERSSADGEDEGEEGAATKGISEKRKKKLLDPSTWERDGKLVATAIALRSGLGDKLFGDYNVFRDRVAHALEKLKIKLSASDLKIILRAVSWRVETAPPVITKIHKPSKAKADPLRGLYETAVDGKKCVAEYEPDSGLRDTEQVPLLEKGGIEAFIRREVLPYTSDAWIKEDATKIGYEVSFTKHFYKPQPLRTLEEISGDILAIEKEAEGLLDDLLKVASK